MNYNITKKYQSLYRIGYLSIFAGSLFMSSALAESLQVMLTDGQTQEIKLSRAIKVKRGDMDRSQIDLQKISTVTIPASVKSIGKKAFSNCSVLQSVNFEADSQLKKIGNCAFCMCGNLKSINIPAKVKDIGEDAFFYCTSLTSVIFAESDQLETIGIAAFRNCKKLKQIIIPSSVVEILEDAFSGCVALSNIIFAENSRLRFIGTMAFSECRKLKKITLPSEVECIGSLAFGGCSGLRDVTFDENCNIIEQNFPRDIFWECRVNVIRAPRAMEEIFGRIWTPNTCHVYYYSKAVVTSETKKSDIAIKKAKKHSFVQ